LGPECLPTAACQKGAAVCSAWSGKVRYLLLAASILSLPKGIAQQPSQRTFKLQVETQLVQVRVRVVGPDGKPVTGLTKTDFAVKENGRRRPVTTLDYIPVPASAQKAVPQVPTATASTQTRHRVWIYIDSEVDSDEVSQAYQAIKQFLSDQLQPGFMVSLDGLPFTDDRARLLATLEKMRQGPYGRLPDVPPLINSTLEMEKQADYEWLLYSAMLWGGGSSAPPPGFANLTLSPGFVRGASVGSQMGVSQTKLDMKETEKEMSFYVQSALYRYLDIIYRLESLPGEKVAVLFRSGLRMDPESAGLLQHFAADAMRHGVHFYTVDSRGLFTIDPSTNRMKLLRYGVPIPAWSYQSPLQFQLALNDYTRTEELATGREEGLIDLARLTGGKSVTNTNDLHTVFNDVVEDSSGYYVIGFYPADKRQLGRFNRLKISVGRPGARVDAPKGYYELRPFRKLSKREKDVVLWRTLQTAMPRDLPVAACVNVFRGDDGQPVAVLSTGVRIGALAAKRKKKISEVHVTELEQIRAAAAGMLPTYHGQNAGITMANPAFIQASVNATEFVTFITKMPVSPGQHICKVVFRDDNTGKLGAEEVRFEAPDYGPAAAASTLLVTRQVAPVPAGAAARPGKDEATSLHRLLQAGHLDFVPQPDREFYRGDKIYLFYELYNPPSYDFNALAASMHTRLLRNGTPVRQFHIDWRILPDPERRAAVLIGTLDTNRYEPGDYQVVQSVPLEAPASGKLFATFTLLPN